MNEPGQKSATATVRIVSQGIRPGPSQRVQVQVVPSSVSTRQTYSPMRRGVAMTPVGVRTSAGGAGFHRTGLSNSAPGGLPLKRHLDYDFNLGPSTPPSVSMGLSRRFQRCTDKSKGLRHFSTKVCEKVKEKGRTNYNEVADELVQEYFESLVAPAPTDHLAREKQQYDMKNIRRRVYDALNVLMAMNIIEKEKKEIRWVGLPTSSIQECRRLEDEKLKRMDRIKHKGEQLQDLIIQLVAYKTLVGRNREVERARGRPPNPSLLYLPYIVVNTDKTTMIDCSISHDKTEYLFSFDRQFEIHDDIEVLKRLGMAHGLEKGSVAPGDLDNIKSYLPTALRGYVDQILSGKLAGSPPAPPQPPMVIPKRENIQTTRQGSYEDFGQKPPIRYAVVQRPSQEYVPQRRVVVMGGTPAGSYRREVTLGSEGARWDSYGDSDYSDMDSTGSNSNQGY